MSERTHVADDHDWEVTRDWHRPAGDPNEWIERKCSDVGCDMTQREGREPTGLPEEPAELSG